MVQGQIKQLIDLNNALKEKSQPMILMYDIACPHDVNATKQ